MVGIPMKGLAGGVVGNMRERIRVFGEDEEEEEEEEKEGEEEEEKSGIAGNMTVIKVRWLGWMVGVPSVLRGGTVCGI